MPSLSIETTSGVNGNTHALTTGADHHATPIPVFPAFPKCWFCPKKGSGFKIHGLHGPAVFPPGPPPPGFAASLPPITVDANGDPTYSPSPSPTSASAPTTSKTSASSQSSSSSSASSSSKKSSSSSTCASSAIRHCTDSVSYGVNSDGTTTATSTTISCSTETACSGIDSTSTTETTATVTSGSCPMPSDYGNNTVQFPRWPEGEIDDYLDNGDGSFVKNDTSSSHSKLQLLSQPIAHWSWPGYQLSHNHRVYAEFKPPYGIEGEPCELRDTIDSPYHPYIDHLDKHPDFNKPGGPAGFYGPDKPPKARMEDPCPSWTWIKYNNAVELFKAQVDGKRYKRFESHLAPNKLEMTVDHVYELKFLPNFFMSLLWPENGNPTFDCKTFNDYFLDRGADDGTNRLRLIFSELPGNIYPDLVALEGNLNLLKACLLQKDGETFEIVVGPKIEAGDKYDEDVMYDIVYHWEGVGIVLNWLHRGEIAAMFRATNKRIYSAFLGIDASIKYIADKCRLMGIRPKYKQIPKPPGGSWAQAYKNFMESLLTDQSHAIVSAVSWKSKNDLKTVDPRNGRKNAAGYALDQFMKTYGPLDKLTFDNAKLLDWAGASTKKIQKRSDDPVCTTDTQDSSSTTPPVSTSKILSVLVADLKHYAKFFIHGQVSVVLAFHHTINFIFHTQSFFAFIQINVYNINILDHQIIISHFHYNEVKFLHLVDADLCISVSHLFGLIYQINSIFQPNIFLFSYILYRKVNYQ
ncbi:MAG: hypothetical protein Q9227_008915 [Pyrenula ochraceoflavens]